MRVMDRIAYYQNRTDELPNQELAKELVESNNESGIAEIAINLWHGNPTVQSDCIKVLYEIGYLNPQLITPYLEDFLRLLNSKHNRLLWGSMLALSTIAPLEADALYFHRQEIIQVMESGSVITVDNAVKVLAAVAANNPAYNQEIFPVLLHHLEICRAKEVPQHSESTRIAVTPENQAAFVNVLEKRIPELSESQLARVKKVIKSL
jgi:hypothetical protein